MSLARRVARRFIAERLSREWVMGVRRGWLTLMKPQIRTWDDVYKALAKLRGFSDNLYESVRHIHRDMTVEYNSTRRKRFETLFNRLDTAIGEARDRAKHWQSVAESTSAVPMGTFKPEEGEQMFALFRDKFEDATGTSVRRQGGSGLYRDATLTELMDRILEMLREDVIETRKWEELNPTAPGWHPEDLPKEFAIGRTKFVVVLPRGERIESVEKFPQYIREAHDLIQRKGLGHLWYGTCFLSPKCEDLTESDLAAYESLGYDRKYVKCRAGWYDYHGDVMAFTHFPTKSLVGIMVHELGHRHWFKFMTKDQREKFRGLISNRNLDTRKKLDLRWLENLRGQLDQWGTIARFSKYSERQTGGWPKAFMEHAQEIVGKAADTMRAFRNPESSPEMERAFRAGIEIAKDLADFYLELSRKAEARLPLFANIEYGQEKDSAPAREQEKEAAEGLPIIDRLRAQIEAYGSAKFIPSVTDYGESNPDEAFAEAFEHYILERDMSRDQMESLRSVLASGNASPYKHWDHEQRKRELRRLDEYAMDVDADGGRLPPKIQQLIDAKRRLTEQEEDILIAWSESNTPGQY